MTAPDARPRTFANHRAIPPASFLVAGLVITVEAGHRVWLASHGLDFWGVWTALAWVSLLVVWVASRQRALIVQDRLIRLEMRLRLERLLGPARRSEVGRLTLAQLVALRFASDTELPALLERVLAGTLERPQDIKRAVTDWQTDWLRV